MCELNLGLPKGCEIAAENCSHSQPFRDRLSPAHFAQSDRPGGNHLAVKRKDRLEQFGLDRRSEPFGYAFCQVQAQRYSGWNIERNCLCSLIGSGLCRCPEELPYALIDLVTNRPIWCCPGSVA